MMTGTPGRPYAQFWSPRDSTERKASRENVPGPPPIILLSGNLDNKDKARAKQAGVFAILDKPCNFSEFVSMVQLALDR